MAYCLIFTTTRYPINTGVRHLTSENGLSILYYNLSYIIYLVAPNLIQPTVSTLAAYHLHLYQVRVFFRYRRGLLASR
jgi:hypothetical protein